MERVIRAFSLIAVAVALLLVGGAVPPVAATSGVTVSIDAPAAVDPDSGFAASISISEVTDFDACNYDVTFDDTVLRLDNVTEGLIGLTAIPVDLYNELSPGTYRIIQNVPGLSGANGSGSLAVLHFHVIGAAGDNSLVGPSNGVISAVTAVEIEANWVEGAVTVVTEASQAAIPPVAANQPPEANLPPLAPSADSGGVPVLWLLIGGAVFLGLIILFVVARMRAY
jgi:hypothetical protein